MNSFFVRILKLFNKWKCQRVSIEIFGFNCFICLFAFFFFLLFFYYMDTGPDFQNCEKNPTSVVQFGYAWVVQKLFEMHSE